MILSCHMKKISLRLIKNRVSRICIHIQSSVYMYMYTYTVICIYVYSYIVSIRQHTQHTSAHVSIRQHMSAYVFSLLRWLSSACVNMGQHASANVNMCQHTSAYVSMCQHTSAYFSIRVFSTEVPQQDADVKNTVRKKTCHYRQVCVDKTDPVIFLSLSSHWHSYVRIQFTSHFVSS